VNTILLLSDCINIFHAATYHGAGKNVCEPTDPDAVRTILGCFGYVGNKLAVFRVLTATNYADNVITTDLIRMRSSPPL
jgi:hypothetical protein